MSHPDKDEVASLARAAALASDAARTSRKKTDRELAEQAGLLHEQARCARRAAVLELARKIHRDLTLYGHARIIRPAQIASAGFVENVTDLGLIPYEDVPLDGRGALAIAMEAAERFTP